jgi:hypothetical protein
MTFPALLANNELVAMAFATEVFGDSSMVGTTLPEDMTKWKDKGFVQILKVGGVTGLEIPTRAPVISFSTWANSGSNSKKPPWGRANNMAEMLVIGALKLRPHRISLANILGRTGYPDVQLSGGRVIVDPIRLPDPSSYARYSTDIQLFWVPVIY